MKDILSIVIAVTVVLVTMIVGVVYTTLQRDQAMKSNIESAIVKGIDPVAVRCAYSSNTADAICVAYAATKAGK
jgi:low affinity Fe/Cu permease